MQLAENSNIYNCDSYSTADVLSRRIHQRRRKVWSPRKKEPANGEQWRVNGNQWRKRREVVYTIMIPQLSVHEKSNSNFYKISSAIKTIIFYVIINFFNFYSE